MINWTNSVAGMHFRITNVVLILLALPFLLPALLQVDEHELQRQHDWIVEDMINRDRRDMGAVAEAVAAALLAGLVVRTTAAGSSVQWREEGPAGVGSEVTYDHRALVISGTRRLLFSGEIHYPRSTPEVT